MPKDISEQQRLADEVEQRLSSITKMRAAAERQAEAIKVLPSAKLRSIFSPLKLPNEWKLTPLSELCMINPSKPKNFIRNGDASTTFIPMEAVDDIIGRVISQQVRPYSTVARGYTYFEEGDILFAKITPCMQNGKTTIVNGLLDGIGFGSTEFHVFRAKPGISSRWIYYILRSAEFRRKAEENFEGSAGQRRVPDYFFKNVKIPFCTNNTELNRLIKSIDANMEKLYRMYNASMFQLEAISALPSATLREFFNFGNEVGA